MIRRDGYPQGRDLKHGVFHISDTMAVSAVTDIHIIGTLEYLLKPYSNLHFHDINSHTINVIPFCNSHLVSTPKHIFFSNRLTDTEEVLFENTVR